MKNINTKTENTLINQKNKFKIDGGIAECIKFENLNILSRIKIKKKKILELGCGVFPVSIGVANIDMPKYYLATDTSKKVLKAAKLNDNRPTYKFIDLEKEIKLKTKFDVIVLKGVIHHIKKPEIILKKIKIILKKNGCIVISEPNLSSIVANTLKWILIKFFKISMEDSPYGQYEIKKINKAIIRSGLRVSKKWYSGLLLIPLTGDYGRIKTLPDNKRLFIFLIFIEKVFYNIFKCLFLTKFLYFKVNLIVKK
jgi:2-polyprenyl-3-methyl-5-hydroxy-6-metoxy-1,4-benzoquinol methylase